MGLVYNNSNTYTMGNCMTQDEKGSLCALCDRVLLQKYAYCIFCHDRFHYRCLQAYNPHLNTCSSCGRQRIRFLYSGKENYNESSNKSDCRRSLIRNSI